MPIPIKYTQMLQRIIYTCYQLLKHRKAIASYNKERSLQVASITELLPRELKQSGIKCLAIDFDGVLASDSKSKPAIKKEQWLRTCYREFTPQMMFILSNKPTQKRKYYFNKFFPNLTVIDPKRKKPFPDGIHEILQQTKLAANEVLVIDDRLATGILAAIIAGTKACFITQPDMDFRAHPIRESFFLALRKLERWLF